MISKAIVQSAIVLMNRRMKVERGVITFDSVRSSVEDMHLHHLGGTNQAQAQMSHCAKVERIWHGRLIAAAATRLNVLLKRCMSGLFFRRCEDERESVARRPP